MRQPDRAIDWHHDDTVTVLRKIRAADGSPGVRDEIAGLPCHLYDAHADGRLHGAAGTILARRAGAICRATTDGAIWITHLKRADDAHALKLPSAMVLGEAAADVAEAPLAAHEVVDYPTWRPIRYEEAGLVGFLLTAVFWGAVTLLTPCVFPMIPITVSYFLKQGEKKLHNPLTMALVYSGTIVVVLGILGASLLVGANRVTQNTSYSRRRTG